MVEDSSSSYVKTGGRRLAERWRWRNRVVGSSSVAEELNLLDLKMAIKTETMIRKQANVNTEDKMAIRLGLSLLIHGGEKLGLG